MALVFQVFEAHMETAGSGLIYQAERKTGPSQAPDDLSFLTQIWMNHSNNNERLNNASFGGQSLKVPHASSLPVSPAAASAAPPSQSTLSASDAILNAGQLRKEPPNRAAALQSQSGDALLQAFSELPQQQSLKVNTAQLAAAANGPRASQDSQRAQSPFWLRPPSQGPVTSQVLLQTLFARDLQCMHSSMYLHLVSLLVYSANICNPQSPGFATYICMQVNQNSVTGGATSTGVFLGNTSYANFNTAVSPNPQMYAQQLQGMLFYVRRCLCDVVCLCEVVCC